MKPANSVPNYRDARFVVTSKGLPPYGFDELQHARAYVILLLPAESVIRDTERDTIIYDECPYFDSDDNDDEEDDS
jgi:hypothetical protein